MWNGFTWRMRIAYFQMDKHSSIALHDLHIFPTKNQIIVTLLFGPNFVILDLADIFCRSNYYFQLPVDRWVTNLSRWFHPGPSHDPDSHNLTRSKGPIYSKERRNLALEATSSQAGENKTNPPEGWEILQTSSGRIWDGFLFTTFNFWLLASNRTNCRHEG